MTQKMNKFNSLKKTTKVDFATYLGVIVVFIITTILQNNGSLKRSAIGLLVPICCYMSKAAEHHEHEDEDGEVEVELRRLKGRVVQAVERACRARKGGGGDERHELILRQVQADGLRGDAVVADGHDTERKSQARSRLP